MFSKFSLSKNNKKKKRNSVPQKSMRNFFWANDEKKFKKRKKSHFKRWLLALGYYFGRHNFKIIAWAWIAICISIILFLLIWPVLRVENILVTRQDTIININQAYSSLEYIRWKNILFLDTSEIVARLQKSQNSIKNIAFNIKFPKTIEISLGAYSPVFQMEKSLILSNGTLLSKENTSEYDIPTIRLVSDDIDEDLTFWKNLNVQDIKKIELLLQELQKNILGISIISIQYFVSEKELILANEDQTLFIFDLGTDIERQIEQLSIYQKEGRNLAEKKYVYIDVRIPQKLYVCPLENEYSCRQNIITIYDEEVFNSLNVPADAS